jgi:hypothetical protein
VIYSKHGEFAGTEYYGAGLGLIAAYESGSQEELKDHVNKGVFKYLNNQVFIHIQHPFE